MAGSFDVFFSYSSSDHVAVERVARDLAQRGIRVFLDRWYLTPGQSWPQALERTLAACNAVAVFIGAKGLGPWQQRERDLALDRQGRDPTFPVVPVLLTSTDPGLGFLRLNTWVDLTSGVEDENALAIFCAAIRGEPPGPLDLQRSASVRAAVCPYRGLRPFREEDEPFFFGRTGFAETLTTTALRHPFVAVVGASGSGKSSVVRAGLLPRLRRGAGGFVWNALTLVPTDRPLHSLAAALLPALEPNHSEVDRLAEVGKLAGHFVDGTVLLRDVAARVLARQPGTDRLLLFVDQWEELYTLCTDEAVRGPFVDCLIEAAATERARVVLTLRGDFMGHALANRALSDRLQNAVVTIGPMTRNELAETITRPAEAVGLSFEAGLVETILDEVGAEPGTLPLLEFLLEGLWAERRGSMLTHDAYTRLGRVSGAIAHRAEEVFERGLTEAEREAAQRLLVRMVRTGEGVEDTRRRTALPTADAIAEATIRKLAAERLVVTERDAGSGDVTVEVAHEALIRRWQRLREWIDRDREFLRTRERIAALAETWKDEGRPSDRLLPAGRPLEEGKELLATRRDDLEPELVAYIEASVAAEVAKIAAARAKDEAERAAERRRTRNARVMSATMLLLAIVAAGFASWWRTEREAALKNLRSAEVNESRALAALANSETDTGSPATALRVALAALPESLGSPSRAYALDAEGAAMKALLQLRECQRLKHETPFFFVAFSPDGRALATGSRDKTVQLWDVATSKQTAVLRGHEEDVASVAFSPNGRTLATGAGSAFGTRDNTARLWDVATGKQITVLRGHERWVSSVAFSLDGQALATGSGDNTARLWGVATGKQIAVLRGHERSVSSVAFSPDGKLLATGSSDNTARLWDVATGKQIAVLRGHENSVSSVAFSLDGKLLATGSSDKTARLWEVPTGEQIAVLRSDEGWVNSVAFSPDGRTLATGSGDKTARLWDVAAGREIAVLRGHEAAVTFVAFSPDGRTLATGSGDKTARLWDVAAGREIAFLRGHESWVSSVAFSLDGRALATGSGDNTARLWDVATGKQIAVLRGHEEPVSSVAFSPNGRTLATGAGSAFDRRDNTARLWDVATGKQITVLRGREHAESSVAFNPDGRTLATGSGDGTARLWDVATGKQIAVVYGHQSWVISVTFDPDGRTLATGSWDNTARLWDVATGKQITVLRGENAVYSVAFSPDGRLLATGSGDNTARLWDVATGKQITVLRGENAVYSVAFSPDGRLLATGSGENTARLWEVPTGKQIAVLRGHERSVSSVAFSPDGKLLATGSDDNTVGLWPIGQHLVDLACARVHDLPLSETDKQRFGIEKEWCTPEVSAALRAKLGLDKPLADPAASSAH